MDSHVFDLTKLFDADSYYRSGKCPWTFFAYPTTLADSRGLPPDEDVRQLLGELQFRGITIGVWMDPVANGTTYLACPKHEREQLGLVLRALEQQGLMENEFLTQRCERLFSSVKTDEGSPS